jgi:class 3 adenylate cyclase/tetratricopeptide (TPR) repeat protein
MMPAAAPVRGRRVVTILFADLTGSTALQERMDPELVRVVMQRYYALIREVVEGRGGRVVKFIGDGAMAVFGVPETREDDARRALEAALALHGAFGALASEVQRDRDVAISLRVGVNTGEVVVGVDDDDVVGDAVNVAARLERAARSGAVLVGEATWRLTRGEAAFEDVRELHVAGKADTVRARTLVGFHRDVVEAGAEFVGRAHEMEVLRAALDEVAHGRVPRVVTVLGSPGVGKTRLGAELERLVSTEALVLVARCSQQTTAPLVPIAEMLQSLSSDPDGLTIEGVVGLFGDGDLDSERVLRTLTAIVQTGAGSTPEETLWALRRVVEALTNRQPVVLVVDDLQWGETMLLDLVEHLAEWTRGPLLLVLLARPELRERRGALTDGARHRVLGLQGLDPEATARLACELLGAHTLPVELLERLPASTGGNPLFVRELLHMLVDDEVLHAGAGGRWALRVPPDAIDVPPTIQSLLAARLDRLSADEQVVLERASVWGTAFPLGALVELLPPDRHSGVPAIMEQLRRKELVESDGTYWVDQPVYRFHHVLIRDAAYRRLLRDRRAVLHEAIASWIQEKTATLEAEYDDLVGHHLEQAYLQRRELGPLNEVTVSVGRAASERLAAAAQRALDRDDPLAGPLAARALDCLPAGDAARAELLLIRCEALLSAADAMAARDAVGELERIAASSARLRAWAACFATQLATLTDPAHLRHTEERAAGVAAELAALDDVRGAAKAHTVHAAALARLGRFAEVEEALDRALTAAHQAGDRRLATVALAAAPVAAVWGPSPVPRAGGRCLDVVRLLRLTAGSPLVEATSLRCQAVLEAFRGRMDAARRLVVSAQDMLEELGLVHGLLEADLFAGIVELSAGALDAADERLQRAYDGLRQLGDDADAARAAALLARVELERGHLDNAGRLAGQAGQLAGDDLQAGIAWRRVQAEVLARRGRHDEARALAEAAVAIAARTDALVQHADACLGLAAVRRAAGDMAGSVQAAAEAGGLYDRKGATALAEGARAAVDPSERGAPPRPQLSDLSFENACTRWQRAMADPFERRDWDAISALQHQSVVCDDRRSLVPMRRVGRDTYLRSALQVLVDRGVNTLTWDVHALRGEHLSLVSFGGLAPDGSSIEVVLWVSEVGPDGLLRSCQIFDLDDLDRAAAELDLQYIEGEGAPFAEMLRLASEAHRAANVRDWDAAAACYTPDVIIRDHHWRGFAERRGRDETLDAIRHVAADMPDAHWTIRAIRELSNDVMVATIQITGRGAEVVYQNAYHRGPGGIDRVDGFGAHDLDAALAAARSLAARPGEPSNRCTEVWARRAALFRDRDWDAQRALFTPDAVYDDRRPVVRTLSVGDDTDAHAREPAAHGIERIATRVLAIRGERLALIAVHGVSLDPAAELFSAESLAVIEVTKSGQLDAYIRYAPDDLDSAVAELDRRYIEGDGAPYATLLSGFLVGWRAINARDWQAFPANLAPDVVLHDHQWSLAEGTGREALVEIARRSIDAVPGSHLMVVQMHAVSDRTLAAEIRLSDGAADMSSAASFYQVAHHGLAGFDRLESFGPDALEDALAAYRAMTGQASETLSNRCTEIFGRVAEHFAARDWDRFSAGLSAGFVYDDHRSVVNTHTVGRRDAVAHVQIAAEQGLDRLAFTPLAIRADHLALLRTGTPAEDSFESVMLSVVSSTNDGRLESSSVYDLADADRAIAELDRRYLDGEGAPHAAILRPALASQRAINARDWDAFRACCAPDVVFVEHLYRGWGGAEGRDAAVALVRRAIEAIPESHVMVRRIHAVSERAIVYEGRLSQGRAPTAASTHADTLMVAHLGPSGVDRVETFGSDDLDEALAAYRRLAAPALHTPSNRSTETQRRICEHFAARDWDAFTAALSEGFVYDDHRSVVNTQAVGRREAVAHMQIAAEQGADRLAFTPLAVRGASHALVRMGTQSDTDAENSFASVMLAVISNTNNGRQDRVTVYDLDDEDRAIADLERRYVESEGAPYAEILTLLAEGIRAINQRDWDHLQACFSPAVTEVEHQYAGWDSHRGRADMLAGFIEFTNSLPGARTTVREIHACTTDALLDTTVFSGHSEDGGPVEFVYHSVCHRAGRFLDHIESFGPDALDDARAAYRLLIAETTPTNRCTEVFGRWANRFAARDWDGMGALVTDDYVYVDHRPVLGLREVGRDHHRRTMQILSQQGGDRVVYTILATRAERHALLRLGFQSDQDADDSFASVMLGVVTSSPDDRFASITVFGLDDEDRARAELERQYQQSEMAP